MGVDQQLVITAVDRVVQNRLVEPELYPLNGAQRPIQHERVADLRRHGVVYAFVRAPFGHLPAVRIAKQDPHPNSGTDLLGEDLLDC